MRRGQSKQSKYPRFSTGMMSKLVTSNLAQAMMLPRSKIHSVGLFKMFSRWIWGIFNIQIQNDRGHKLMLFMFQNKDKDLLDIYQYGCDPFCVPNFISLVQVVPSPIQP